MTGNQKSSHLASRAPQSLAGGVVLIALAACAFYLARGLPVGSFGAMGPGMLPVLVASFVAGLGLLLVGQSFLTDGPPMDGWTLRGPALILGAVVLFAVTIRGFDFGGGFVVPPLGMAVAGPLVIFVGGLADRDARLGELVLFGFVMSAVCVGLFRYALGLSIPVAPFLIGY